METLATYMAEAEPDWTQAQWAAFFGISRPHLNMILSGRAHPSRKLIERIRDRTGDKVPASSWFPPVAAAE